MRNKTHGGRDGGEQTNNMKRAELWLALSSRLHAKICTLCWERGERRVGTLAIYFTSQKPVIEPLGEGYFSAPPSETTGKGTTV